MWKVENRRQVSPPRDVKLATEKLALKELALNN
jgi:hypothetical protein